MGKWSSYITPTHKSKYGALVRSKKGKYYYITKNEIIPISLSEAKKISQKA